MNKHSPIRLLLGASLFCSSMAAAMDTQDSMNMISSSKSNSPVDRDMAHSDSPTIRPDAQYTSIEAYGNAPVTFHDAHTFTHCPLATKELPALSERQQTAGPSSSINGVGKQNVPSRFTCFLPIMPPNIQFFSPTHSLESEDLSVSAVEHIQGDILPIILAPGSNLPNRATYVELAAPLSTLFEKAAEVYGIDPEFVRFAALKAQAPSGRISPIHYNLTLAEDRLETIPLTLLEALQTIQTKKIDSSTQLEVIIDEESPIYPVYHGNYFIPNRASFDFAGFQSGNIVIDGSENFISFTVTAPSEYLLRMLLQSLDPSDFPHVETIYLDSEEFLKVRQKGLKDRNALFYEDATRGKGWSSVTFVLRDRTTGEVHYQFSR